MTVRIHKTREQGGMGEINDVGIVRGLGDGPDIDDTIALNTDAVIVQRLRAKQDDGWGAELHQSAVTKMDGIDNPGDPWHVRRRMTRRHYGHSRIQQDGRV
jgi:hypothetical protein